MLLTPPPRGGNGETIDSEPEPRSGGEDRPPFQDLRRHSSPGEILQGLSLSLYVLLFVLECHSIRYSE